MASKTFYYARVSSRDQNLDRQIQAFKAMGADDRDIITDKESGKDTNRSGYQTLRNNILREGDTLVIKSLDRLSRSKKDIKNELEFFKDRKIRVKILDLPTTLIDLPDGQEWVFDMCNNILIEVLGAIAEQERITTHKRQEEGIAAAKSKGVQFGRPKANFPEGWENVYTQWKANNITAVKAMDLLDLKRTTFYKLVKLYEEAV